MDTNKTTAIIVSIGLFVLGLSIFSMSLSDAWKNTPTNYSINFHTDNETKESIKSISQSTSLNCEYEKLELYSIYLENGYLEREDLQ